MSYQLYPSDLTDREWEYIKEMIPPPKPGGRDRNTDMRQVVNAISSSIPESAPSLGVEHLSYCSPDTLLPKPFDAEA
jgi:hypothetical protein